MSELAAIMCWYVPRFWEMDVNCAADVSEMLTLSIMEAKWCLANDLYQYLEYRLYLPTGFTFIYFVDATKMNNINYK